MFDAILFDLDGTLLPMDQDAFTKAYFTLLSKKMAEHGYESKALIENIWKGTYGMIQNNGSKTNEQVFWDVFSQFYGEKAIKDQLLFESFYENEFQKAQASCGKNEMVPEIIKSLKKDTTLILATNPIFPKVATYSRIRWAGLEPDDFIHITTYENSHSCKPNLIYYQEIVDLFHLDPKKCLMVGNDVLEDMITEKLGFNVFLLTDNLLNTKNLDYSQYPQGNFKDLMHYIEANK